MTVPQTIFKFMLKGVSISLKISLPIFLLNLENSGSHYSNNIWPFNLQSMWFQCTCVNSIPNMNKIARFHQSITNINFEMLFAYITSENQQRQQLLQQLLGIFPRPVLLIFFMEKPIAAVILCLFVIKMSTETGISSLFSLLFRWHAQNQLASVNFSFWKIAGNFGIATEKNLMSSTYITSKFDPNWDLNFKTVPFYTKFNAPLLWKPSWLEINCKNEHLTSFFTGTKPRGKRLFVYFV